MSIETFSDIVVFLDKINVKEVCIEGGEPLCHQKFDLICHSLSTLLCTKKIVTNATLLTDDSINLIDKTFDVVQVSIDGGTKAEYENIRGLNSFSNLIKGVELLSNIKNKVQINFVLTSLNYLNIDKLFSFAFSYGLYRFRFVLVVDFSRKIIPSEDIISCFILKVIELKKQYRNAEISFVFPEQSILPYTDLLLLNGISNYIGICYAATVYTVIDSDKTVYPCNFLTRKKPLFSFCCETFFHNWKMDDFLNNVRKNLQTNECIGCPANYDCL